MVDDTNIKITFGWSMITFICLMLLYNLILILIDLFHSIKLILIKIYNKIMKKITKWVIKYCIGEPFSRNPSLNEDIEKEKEEIRIDIENDRKFREEVIEMGGKMKDILDEQRQINE